MKIASRQKEIIEVHILDPVYPPFDDQKIETIRQLMANRGGMVLSRVSNKDINENKSKKFG